jgi:hypothetical protein
MAFFFSRHTFQPVHFPGKGGVFTAGLVTLGVDVRPWGRSGYHVSLAVWTVCYLFLLSANQQVRSYPRQFTGSAGSVFNTSGRVSQTAPRLMNGAHRHIISLPAGCLYCRIQGHLLQLVKRLEHDGHPTNIRRGYTSPVQISCMWLWRL